MPDLSHLWGNDLSWSASGDLATADTAALTQQRMLRRLLTTPGEYLWALDYGTGLPAFVGTPGAQLAIRAAVRAQIAKEPGVGRSPAPVIDLLADAIGGLYVHLRYADAATGSAGSVAFNT